MSTLGEVYDYLRTQMTDEREYFFTKHVNISTTFTKVSGKSVGNCLVNANARVWRISPMFQTKIIAVLNLFKEKHAIGLVCKNINEISFLEYNYNIAYYDNAVKGDDWIEDYRLLKGYIEKVARECNIKESDVPTELNHFLLCLNNPTHLNYDAIHNHCLLWDLNQRIEFFQNIKAGLRTQVLHKCEVEAGLAGRFDSTFNFHEYIHRSNRDLYDVLFFKPTAKNRSRYGTDFSALCKFIRNVYERAAESKTRLKHMYDIDEAIFETFPFALVNAYLYFLGTDGLNKTWPRSNGMYGM